MYLYSMFCKLLSESSTFVPAMLPSALHAAKASWGTLGRKLCTVSMYDVFCHLASGTDDGAGRTLIEDDQREIHK